jgi:hypothetical protein
VSYRRAGLDNHGYCGVAAISALTGVSQRRIRFYVLRGRNMLECLAYDFNRPLRAGLPQRIKNVGTTDGEMVAVMRLLGMIVERVPLPRGDKRLAAVLPRLRVTDGYLCSVSMGQSGHALAIRGTRYFDNDTGKDGADLYQMPVPPERLRVDALWRVMRPDDPRHIRRATGVITSGGMFLMKRG